MLVESWLSVKEDPQGDNISKSRVPLIEERVLSLDSFYSNQPCPLFYTCLLVCPQGGGRGGGPK